jgi:transcription elongation factor GreB
MADKKFLTKEGHAALSAELDKLLRQERPRVVQGVAEAAAEGDRSENAEYIYGKKRLREIDKRLKYLGGLLKGATIVDRSRLAGDTVCFGATVLVEDEDGQRRRWTIVGEGEADAARGTISDKAPLARALMGKQVGDVVEVLRPAGETEVEILAITFGV